VARAFYAGKLQAVPADLARRFGRTYRFAYDKFRVDELYDVAVIRPIQLLARTLWRVVDVGIIEGVFVNGIPRALAASSGVIRKAQNGDVQRYAAVIAVAAAVILWIVLGLGGH
jgi:NADH-quinone oxidoreductase subunit L